MSDSFRTGCMVIQRRVLTTLQNIKEGIEGRPAGWYNEIFDIVFPNLDHEKANMDKASLYKGSDGKKSEGKDKDGNESD